TTASSLEAKQGSGNINKTPSKATLNEPSSIGTSSGSGPRVLDLENTKITQALEIDSLKRRVKKLETKKRSRTHNLKRLYKERIIDDIDADEGITLVDETVKNQGRFNDQEDAEMLFDVVDDLRGEEVFVSQEVPLKETELVVESSNKAEAEVTEGSSKRAREELEQENTKKQKMEDGKESVEFKQCLEIIPDNRDDVTNDATPLSSKSSTIVDYKIHKEGKKSYF
nr:hypothetical protein [Tanacetum cinerariifolium]